jgi:hypothetical protein
MSANNGLRRYTGNDCGLSSAETQSRLWSKARTHDIPLQGAMTGDLPSHQRLSQFDAAFHRFLIDFPICTERYQVARC